MHWKEKEGALPDNVDAADAASLDPETRARMARVFKQGLEAPIGYVLPIRRLKSGALGKGWLSEAWKTRRGSLFLTPGDSPVGLRLPLDTLPHVPPKEYPYINPRDPAKWSGNCRAVPQWRPRIATPKIRTKKRAPGRKDHVRTALVAEKRAAASSMCSCRRLRRWKIISNCSRRSRKAPSPSAPRCALKAMSRRAIRALR